MAQTYGVNPYAYGAQVFDTTPYAKVFLERQAKEQAKQEAIDKYFREQLTKGINKKGLRPQEQQVVSQIENERKNFYAQNREALKRNDLEAIERFNRFGADIEQVLSGGLEVSEKNKQLYPAIQKSKYGVTENFLKNRLPLMEQPRYIYKNGEIIDNPNFQLVDVTDIEQNAKPWDIDDDAKIRTYLTAGLTPRQIGEPIKKKLTSDPRQEYSVKVFDLTPEMKKQFEQRAYNAYAENDRLREKIDNLPQADYERLYDKAVKNNLGAIAEGYDVKPFLAVEYMKESYMPQGYEEKTEAKESLSSQIQREERRQDRSDARVDAMRTQTGQPTVSGNEFDKIFAEYKEETNLFGGGKGVGVKVKEGFVTKDGQPYNGYLKVASAALPAQLKNILISAGYGVQGDGFKTLPDSEFTIKYKDGRVEYIKGARMGVLDRTAMENAQLAYDKEPQKGQKPLFGQPKENVKPTGGRTITKDQFRKMSLSERQSFISSGGKVN